MASKKSRPLDDPPAVSSSEEEESSSEEEEEEVPEKPQSKPQPQSEEEESEEEEEEEEEEVEGVESEDEEEKQKKKTQKQTQVPRMTPQPEPEPDSETESESQKASDFTIKPIKSAEEKPETPETSTPVSKPSAKRRSENGGKVASKSKKAKPSSEEEEEGGEVSTPVEKKSAINRLWSEKDELAILQGLIDFQANAGKDPSAHQQEFHEFVKKSLRVDASKSQVMDKVRRLKNKFKTAVSKAPNGHDPVYSKPHEVKSFLLAKKIWGASSEKNGVDDTEKSKANANEKSGSRNSKKSSNDKLAVVDANANSGATKEEDMVRGKSEKVGLNQVKDEDDLDKKYPNLMGAFRPDYMSNMSVPDILKGNLNLVGSSELKEMDNKWQKQNAAEVEMFLGRIDLLREQTRMVLGAMRSSKN